MGRKTFAETVNIIGGDCMGKVLIASFDREKESCGKLCNICV